MIVMVAVATHVAAIGPPTGWDETIEFAQDAAAADYFGDALDADGDRIVVGARLDDAPTSAGAVYVLEKTGDDWHQTKLRASDKASFDYFGVSVAIDGDLIVVGAEGEDDLGSAAGAAYVFEYDADDGWQELDKITASGGAAGDSFGSSVAIDGDTVFVAAILEHEGPTSDAGAVYVFERFGDSWNQTQRLIASDPGASDLFGVELAVEGNQMLIGVLRDDVPQSNGGSAYLFTKSGSWSQTHKFIASDANVGHKFGSSVAFVDTRLAVGSPFGNAETTGTGPGAVYIFEDDGEGGWTETQIGPETYTGSPQFGAVMAVHDGDLLISGLMDDEIGSDAGAAHLLTADGGGGWTQERFTSTDTTSGDRYGRALALVEDRVLVGALSDTQGSQAGAVYIYEPTDACRDTTHDSFGYSCRIVAGTFDDITGTGSTLTLDDDEGSAALDLTKGGEEPGFSYYGIVYDDVYVSSNGYLTFDPADLTDHRPDDSPSAITPNALVAGYWTDLNPSEGGEIRYKVDNSPPRTFTAQWTDVPHYFGGPETVTFQIRLLLETGVIEVAFQDVASDGGNALTAIENAGGTVGRTYDFGPFGAPSVGTLDDFGEWVYVNIDAVQGDLVDALDVRLTTAGAEAYGNQVGTADDDIHLELDGPGVLSVCRVNFGDLGSVLDDGLYLHRGTDCSSIDNGDLRLAPYGGNAAGTWVDDADVVEKGASPVAMSEARVRYADVDSDGFYSLGDCVYVQLYDVSDGTLDIGDLRITGTSGGSAGTFTAAGDSDVLAYSVVDFTGSPNLDDPHVVQFHDQDFQTIRFEPPGPPSAPQNISGAGANGQVNVTWDVPLADGNSSVSSYNVYGGTASNALSFLGSVTVPTTTLVDTGLVPGTSYYYHVTALNVAGEGTASDVAMGRTTLPTEQRLFYEDFNGNTSGNLTLSGLWRVDGICQTPPPDADFMLVYNQVSTCDYDAGDTTGNANFTVDLSDVREATLLFDHYWETEEGSSFDLKKVQASSNGGASWTTLATYTGASQQFWEGVNIDLDAYAGGIADIRFNFDTVDSVANSFDGWWLDAIEVRGTAIAPDAPAPVGASADGVGEITVSWAAPPDDGGSPVTSYTVFSGASSGALNPAATVSGSTFSWTETGLANAESRFYAVTATNAKGISPQSGEVSEVTWDLPTKPQSLMASTGPGGGEISLSWVAPVSDGGESIDTYRIQRGATEGGPYSEVGTTASLSFVDTGLANDQTYYYRVVAENEVGPGPESGEVFATTFDVPDAPTASTSNGKSQIEIGWTAGPDDGGTPLTGFRIYLDDPTEGLVTLATTDASTFSHIDGDLADGVTRTYHVVAINAAGESAPDIVSGRTISVPDAPEGLEACSGPGPQQTTLVWDTPFDGDRAIQNFTIYRGLDPVNLSLVAVLGQGDVGTPSTPCAENHGVGGLSVEEGQVVEFVDDGLEEGQRYFYAVAAENSEGEGDLTAPVFGTTFQPESDPEPLPSGRTLTSAAFDGLSAYIFGGLAGTVDDGTSVDSILRFDPTTETLEQVTNTTGDNVTLRTPRHATTSVWVPDVNATGRAFIFFGNESGPSSSGGPAALGCHPHCIAGLEIGIFDPTGPTIRTAHAPAHDPDFHGRHSVASAYVPPIFNGTEIVNGTGLVYLFFGHPVEDGHSEPSALGCHPHCLVGSQIGVFNPPTWKLSVSPLNISDDGAGFGGRWGSSAVYVPPLFDGLEQLNGTGLVYIFGGHPDDHDEQDHAGPSALGCHPHCLMSEQILIFDPEGPTIKMHSVNMSEFGGRWYSSAVFQGDAVYVFGGQNHTGRFDDILRYDFVNGTIKRVGELPSERGGTSAVTTGDDIYIFGGHEEEETLDEVVRFTPSAPRETTATAGGGKGQINVSWEPPLDASIAGVERYNVYSGPTGGLETFLAQVDASQTWFVHGSLLDGQTVSYRVSAVNDIGEGPQSPSVSATTFDRPSAPTAFAAVHDPLSGDVTLSWAYPADDGDAPVTFYRLERDSLPLAYSNRAWHTSGTTIVDDSCFMGDECNYRARANNLVGSGTWTATITIQGTKPGTDLI